LWLAKSQLRRIYLKRRKTIFIQREKKRIITQVSKAQTELGEEEIEEPSSEHEAISIQNEQSERFLN
jgi:hypothetical protein